MTLVSVLRNDTMFSVSGSEDEGGSAFQHINLYAPSCSLAAISSIQEVVNAPDFDRRMLILATQISHKSDKKHVLLVVLECLLKSLKVGSGSESVPETMTLVRCIIKLILGVLVQPATKRYVYLYSVLSFQPSSLLQRDQLIDNIIYHFRTGRFHRFHWKFSS